MFNDFIRYEEEFHQWIANGYPNVKQETLDYLHHLCDQEDYTHPRGGTLWPHQWDALLRVIYSYELKREELTRPNGVLLNVVTGGGKTAIIAALMVWLRIAHDVQRFVLLCPNLIVRDRLEDDFENGKVFADRSLIPQGAIVNKDDFALTTLGSDHPAGWANMLGASVILGNIHQFYTSNATGQANLANLLNGLGLRYSTTRPTTLPLRSGTLLWKNCAHKPFCGLIPPLLLTEPMVSLPKAG